MKEKRSTPRKEGEWSTCRDCNGDSGDLDSSGDGSDSNGSNGNSVHEIPNFWKMKLDPSIRRRVAGGIILNKEFTHIILVRSRNSGKWGIPKGGVEEEETDIEGAIREIYEECGLVIESPLIEAMAPCITYRGVRIFLFCYNAPITDHELIPVDTTEISECEWFSLDLLVSQNVEIRTTDVAPHADFANRLPIISTELYNAESIDLIGLGDDSTLGHVLETQVYQKSRKSRLSMTTLLRDLLKDRLDAIIRKIHTNIDNYQVSSCGRIIINSYLANVLKKLRKAETRQMNIIHDIQLRFPMVFYLPELIRVLEAIA